MTTRFPRQPRKTTPRSQAAPFWMRLALVALVMVQVVAPSWHVCVLGGNTNLKHGGKTAEVAPGMLCIPVGSEAPATNISRALEKAASFVAGTIGAPCDNCATSCLARLLMGMPGSVGVTQSITLTSVEQAAPPIPSIRLASLAALPQPPSRGPPALSAA